MPVGCNKWKNRFSNPSTRCIMAGVLLSPGPVSTFYTVQGLSRVFNNAVNKAKFQSAAKKLEESQLGQLVNVGTGVFIKKPPHKAQTLLLKEDVMDLCTPQEYEDRFRRAPPSTLRLKLQESLVALQLVPAEYFVP